MSPRMQERPSTASTCFSSPKIAFRRSIRRPAGRRDRGEHTAGLRIDLLDAILGELKQVLAVEGGSCMRGDIDRAQRLPARRIEGGQLVSSRKPDVLTVIRDSTHVVDTRKGSVLTHDLGG